MKQLQKLCSAAIYSAILLIGSGQMAVANTIPDELVGLLAQQHLPVAVAPQAVLSGAANAALSQGVWPEAQVLAFKKKFGYFPTVLPLTAIKPSGQPDVLAAMDSGSLFYLVVNYPPQGDVRNALAQNLQTLIGDDFQEQLPDKNFYALPKPVKKMWRVKLGLAEPEFANGYR